MKKQIQQELFCQKIHKKKCPSEKFHQYFVSILFNYKYTNFIIKSQFIVHDEQIIELCDEIIKDKSKIFVGKSISKLDKEDIEEGKHIIIKNLAEKLNREINFNYLGYVKTFELNEINIKENAETRKIEITAGGDFGDEKTIS